VGIGLIGLKILAINGLLRQSFDPRAKVAPVVEATTDIILTIHDPAVGLDQSH
jgi:hypothetical protein